jgi:hypothetical protein
MTRLVFSINSGRSGSLYLYHLLSTAANATAFHEPRPSLAGRYVTRWPASRPTLMDLVRYPVIYAKKREKAMTIRRTLSELPEGHVYVETSHMFILSFYDVVMRHFDQVEIVQLRRYLPRVMKSFLDLNMFTPEDSKTRFWTSRPNSPSAAVTALAPNAEMDPADRCIAYLIDIEARAQRFRRRYPRVPVIETRLEELNDRDRVQWLFDQLRLEPTAKTWSVMGEVRNDKAHEKKSNVSEEYCLERLLQYVDKCRQKGIKLPELPHLHDVAVPRGSTVRQAIS